MGDHFGSLKLISRQLLKAFLEPAASRTGGKDSWKCNCVFVEINAKRIDRLGASTRKNDLIAWKHTACRHRPIVIIYHCKAYLITETARLKHPNESAILSFVLLPRGEESIHECFDPWIVFHA